MRICCRQCGSNNNSGNTLCLTCGCELLERRETLTVPAMPPEQPTGESSSVSPSAEPTDSGFYLFQDQTSHTRRYLVLALVGLTVAVAGWQLRRLSTLAGRFSNNSATSQSKVGNSTQTDVAVSFEEPQTRQSERTEPSESASKRDQDATEKTSSGYPSQEGLAAVPGSSKGQVQPVSASTRNSNTSEAEGEKYLYGDGVPADCERAQQDLLAAAEHSSAKAESTLGTMYATGHCTIRDLPLAYRWFARAQRQTPRNRIIEADIKALWDQMSPEEKKLAKR